MISESLASKIFEDGGLAGRSQLSVAGGCIYLASHLMRQPKMPKEIAKVAGVSESTIRTSYKIVYEKRERFIEADWLKDGKGDLDLLPKV